jgi:hypothetical protein
MKNCDRCGCEIFDFYYLSYAHSDRDEEGNLVICPRCKHQFDEFMHFRKAGIEGKEIGKQNSKFTITFNVPDDYEIIRGDE